MPIPPPVRVGAVSFVNTLPLIEGLDRPGEPGIELSLAPPAELADRMHAGIVDVGLIPVVEHFRSRDYRLIADVAICSRGPVETVMLWCRKPASKVETFAGDVRSRTSIALTQVWSAKVRGRPVRLLDTFERGKLI